MLPFSSALNGFFNEDEIAMHFAEPVTPSDIHEGETYFIVQFVDEEMLVPVVEPVVYVGKNLDDDDVNQFYFQDAASFLAGVRYGSGVNDDALFYKQGEGEINHIFEFEKGLNVLLGCSLRRNIKRTSNGSILGRLSRQTVEHIKKYEYIKSSRSKY